MLKSTRSHLNYANVVATLALFFAMSGGALAAKHYLINSTKQINPKVIKALKGHTGAKGATGATGAVGATGKEGPAGKEATIPALTWTPLKLENGWAEYEPYYGVPSYTKDVEGFVHLKGSLSGAGKTKSAFATLPAGFRPKNPNEGGVWLRAAATNGSSDPHLVDVFVYDSGVMEAIDNGTGANEAFVSLEGLTFYAG